MSSIAFFYVNNYLFYVIEMAGIPF